VNASGAVGGAAEPEPGSEFAGHRIEAVIGRGGMGVVYRARHLALDLDRALKVLAPSLSGDPRFRDRFRRESRLAASIDHPNVIPVHAAGEESGQLYIAMRLVEGRDLRDLIADDGALEPGAATGLVAQVAAALDAAHLAGLVHRDVKPANVLVGSGADAGRVYLTDFGISRTAQAGETVTATGELVGTADFIAPEQIAGDSVDRRADVYALGGVLHYALTGEPPFPRENELATLFAHANAPRPRPSTTRPGLPPALDEVVARAMAVRPEDRYESAGDLATALTVAAPRSREATRGRPEPEAARPRRPLWIAAAVGVTAAIAAVVVIVAGGGGEPGSDPGGFAAERGSDRGGGGRGDAGGEPQPEPARIATVKVGEGPIGVTVGEGAVWTAVHGAGEVVAIDPGAEQVASSAGVPTPSAVAVGFGSVWTVTSLDNSLYRLDPAGGPPQRFEVGLNPSDVAVDGRWVWVTLEGEDRVLRFDPVANAAAGEIAVGDGPRAVATGAGAVWVTNIEGGSVSKIDPSEPSRIPNPIEIEDSRPSDIAVGAGRVWAVDVFGGRLIEIAPGAPAAAPRLVGEAVGDLASPRGVKVGFGSVWVAAGGDSALLRVDPGNRRVTAKVAVGDDPADLAIGEGSIWTADEEGDSVTRIDPAQPSP
jgi:DNA-binding beta-propeller fold protein YncE